MGAASPPRLRRGIIAFSKVVAQEPRSGVLFGCGFAALCLFVANSGSRGFVPEPAPRACTPCSPPGPFDIRPWRAASPVWLRTPGRDSCGDNSSFRIVGLEARARATEWLPRFRPSSSDRSRCRCMDFRTSDRPRWPYGIPRSHHRCAPSNCRSIPGMCGLRQSDSSRSISCRVRPPRPVPSSSAVRTPDEGDGARVPAVFRQPLDEFHDDLFGNDFLPVGFLQQLANGLPSFGSVVECEFVHVHADESIDVLRVQTPGELDRVRHRFFAMIQAILNAVADVLRDPFDQLRSQAALDDVAAKRQRKSGLLQPPLTEIDNLVKTHLAICELSFVNKKAR